MIRYGLRPPVQRLVPRRRIQAPAAPPSDPPRRETAPAPGDARPARP
ncbi:hypothetical protein ACQEUU_31780 [Nonomuraea sp. CA-218870]